MLRQQVTAASPGWARRFGDVLDVRTTASVLLCVPFGDGADAQRAVQRVVTWMRQAIADPGATDDLDAMLLAIAAVLKFDARDAVAQAARARIAATMSPEALATGAMLGAYVTAMSVGDRTAA